MDASFYSTIIWEFNFHLSLCLLCLFSSTTPEWPWAVNAYHFWVSLPLTLFHWAQGSGFMPSLWHQLWTWKLTSYSISSVADSWLFRRDVSLHSPRPDSCHFSVWALALWLLGWLDQRHFQPIHPHPHQRLGSQPPLQLKSEGGHGFLGMRFGAPLKSCNSPMLLNSFLTLWF